MSAEGLTEIDGQIETNYDTVVYKFDDLNLKPAIVRGIFGYGYEVCIRSGIAAPKFIVFPSTKY